MVRHRRTHGPAGLWAAGDGLHGVRLRRLPGGMGASTARGPGTPSHNQNGLIHGGRTRVPNKTGMTAPPMWTSPKRSM
jgi:hypothetical protein